MCNRAAHILVVDDDRGILQMLELALEQEQYTVATARSRGEAMDALRRQAADAVLVDVRLHAEDGIDLARQLRARTQTPLVLMTAGDRPPFDTASVPADAWLMKPFDLADLYGVLRSVLREPARVE